MVIVEKNSEQIFKKSQFEEIKEEDEEDIDRTHSINFRESKSKSKSEAEENNNENNSEGELSNLVRSLHGSENDSKEGLKRLNSAKSAPLISQKINTYFENMLEKNDLNFISKKTFDKNTLKKENSKKIIKNKANLNGSFDGKLMQRYLALRQGKTKKIGQTERLKKNNRTNSMSSFKNHKYKKHLEMSNFVFSNMDKKFLRSETVNQITPDNEILVKNKSVEIGNQDLQELSRFLEKQSRLNGDNRNGTDNGEIQKFRNLLENQKPKIEENRQIFSEKKKQNEVERIIKRSKNSQVATSVVQNMEKIEIKQLLEKPTTSKEANIINLKNGRPIENEQIEQKQIKTANENQSLSQKELKFGNKLIDKQKKPKHNELSSEKNRILSIGKPSEKYRMSKQSESNLPNCELREPVNIIKSEPNQLIPDVCNSDEVSKLTQNIIRTKKPSDRLADNVYSNEDIPKLNSLIFGKIQTKNLRLKNPEKSKQNWFTEESQETNDKMKRMKSPTNRISLTGEMNMSKNLIGKKYDVRF